MRVGGVAPGMPAVKLAETIEKMSNLKFGGLQAYQGRAQHIRGFSERKIAIEKASKYVLKTIEFLKKAYQLSLSDWWWHRYLSI